MLLGKLRKDLQFNGELLSLVDTLKNVAGSQYHLMEKEKARFDLFMDAFSGFFRVVNLVDVDDPLVRVSSDVVGVVIVTSDSGFMGGLNQGVIRAGFEAVEGRSESEISLVIIGDKGAALMNDQSRDFKFFPGIGQETVYEQAIEVKNFIVKEVLEGRMGKVIVAYPRALSFTAQAIEAINLLPCRELFDIEAESEVAERSRMRQVVADAHKVAVESSFSDIVEYLAGVWVASKLYEVFEDSKLAEFSARAMHLEGSVQKVEKEHKKLKQMYSKACHEQIDKGMREGFAAKSLKKKLKKVSAA
ncbi:MAG: F0F1 ATP synthase subunit gamma [Kiritimatiellia bacterium]|jgi:ATP synthase F1 gamma subunit|nr:F0F1 ATP synthase subunit gamma [Kiritimatiellia bacterium]